MFLYTQEEIREMFRWLQLHHAENIYIKSDLLKGCVCVCVCVCVDTS
jgi:hypothetical protein